MASVTAGPVIPMTAGGHRPARLPLPDWGSPTFCAIAPAGYGRGLPATGLTTGCG